MIIKFGQLFQYKSLLNQCHHNQTFQFVITETPLIVSTLGNTLNSKPYLTARFLNIVVGFSRQFDGNVRFSARQRQPADCSCVPTMQEITTSGSLYLNERRSCSRSVLWNGYLSPTPSASLENLLKLSSLRSYVTNSIVSLGRKVNS